MDTSNLFIRVDRKDLVFLNGLIESYDDLAVIKTLSAPEGLAVIMISPGREETVRALLASLSPEVTVEFVTPDVDELSRCLEKIYELE